MSHEVYTTESFVLASTDVQDADKLFWLLTQDFGLIFASAKSVRSEVSKLRYALQDISYTEVSLVRGRSIWRITGAQIPSTHANMILSTENRVVFGRIATLARRVVPLQEPNVQLYVSMYVAYQALLECTTKTRGEHIEQITVARLLYQLGYISKESIHTDILTVHTFDFDMHIYTPTIQKTILDAINKGLIQSQL